VLKNHRTTVIHRIGIIGDNHAREVAGNVKHNLDATFSTSGIVCPGINVGNMIPLMTSNIKHLNRKDVMILWGGANDVYNNNSWDALKLITEFMEINKHTNIIILCIPHRHDLPEWSCVNKGILAFNRALMKLMKPYNHVTVVHVDTTRIYYTRQGQHMNNLGKERIALSLAKLITNMFSTQEKIITLPWKGDINMISSYDFYDSDSDITSIKTDPTAPPVGSTTMTLEVKIDVATKNEQPDSYGDSDKDCDKVNDDITLGQTQTQVIIHTTDCGSVNNLPESIQNTLTTDEDKITFPKQKQEEANNTNCDCDSDNSKKSDGVDDNDSDSDTVSDSDSDNDTKPLVLIQDTATTDATEGKTIPLTEIHEDTVETGPVDSDRPIEICRISTRNKKAPSFKSNDFLW
jgi:hypothetical protein